ncbi:30S ribosomal protein S3 [Patescibacteria group bacterium]|nr:30S ribosomal protein S3 [Patescibacteria group bacterium]
MSHKVHPKILRIRETKDWSSRGLYQKKFPQYLEEDFELRNFLSKRLPRGTVENIEVERGQTLLKIIIKTARPALVIGRGGEEIERLKKDLEKILEKKKRKTGPKREIKIEIIEVRNPWSSSSLCSQWIASQIEKRVPYRRCLKMALRKIMGSRGVKGAKVQVAGRLNGIEISRTEWLKEGELPRQNLRGVIDYGTAQAYCTYGVIGVKVWIYKGEQFE